MAAIVPEIADALARHRRDGQTADNEQTRQHLKGLLDDPVLAPVILSAGLRSVELVDEVESFRPELRTSVPTLETWVRMFLLSQIEARWWEEVEPFQSDRQLEEDPDLVDLEPLRRAGRLGFRYRRQPAGLIGRAASRARRHLWPNRMPLTAGMRFTRTRPECVALLNQLAAEWRARIGRDDPSLWVTSVVRTLDHQYHLRSLGYSAVIPSAHCSGHAADIAVQWLDRFGLAGELRALLLEYQDADRLNAIDEGPTWHICVHPQVMVGLRSQYHALIGS